MKVLMFILVATAVEIVWFMVGVCDKTQNVLIPFYILLLVYFLKEMIT